MEFFLKIIMRILNRLSIKHLHSTQVQLGFPPPPPYRAKALCGHSQKSTQQSQWLNALSPYTWRGSCRAQTTSSPSMKRHIWYSFVQYNLAKIFHTRDQPGLTH